MASALGGIALDDRHAAYLLDMVRSAPTAAIRPVARRGHRAWPALAGPDALYAAHPADLDRAGAALAEIGLAYDFAAPPRCRARVRR